MGDPRDRASSAAGGLTPSPWLGLGFLFFWFGHGFFVVWFEAAQLYRHPQQGAWIGVQPPDSRHSNDSVPLPI